MDKLQALEKHFTLLSTPNENFLVRGDLRVRWALHRNRLYLHSMDSRVWTIPLAHETEAFIDCVIEAFEELAS